MSELGVSTETSCDLAVFERLEPEWRTLFESSSRDNYFTSYDWCKCWWESFGAPAGWKPVIIGVRREGQLVALLPLSVRRVGPLNSADLMAGETGQYSDMLITKDAECDSGIYEALWTGIVSVGIDRLQLCNVRDDSALARMLLNRRKIHSEETFSCCLDTGSHESFDKYMQTRSQSLRKSLRRRRRKLEAIQCVNYSTVTRPDLFKKTFSTIVAHKLEWLGKKGLHGRFLAKPEIASWMSAVASAALRSGHLHLSLLCVGNQIAAAQFGFVCGGRMTAYFASFDPEFSTYAVGRMQAHDFIKGLFDQDMQIDFMPPDDGYKLEWADRGISTRSYTVPITRLGNAVSVLVNSRNREKVKRIYLSLPRGIRAPVAAAGLGALKAMTRNSPSETVHKIPL